MPGEIAHTDVMTSSVPGLIAQIVGFVTSKKVYHTSFFVGDESDYAFVHQQESTSADETTIDKKSCGSELRKHGKEVRCYQADNGACATTKNKEEIKKTNYYLLRCMRLSPE